MDFGRRAQTDDPTRSRHRRQRKLPWLTAITATLLLIAACSGPATGDDSDPTPTATATSIPTETPVATPTSEPTATVTPTVAATASPTLGASPVTNASPSGSPSVASGSPTSVNQQLKDELPTLAELPAEGFTISSEGTHTAQELANFYSDNAAHLQRLTDWGFKAHVYREFGHTSTGADDPLPYDILCTVNVYGSPDQAQMAIDFLKKLDLSLGKTEVEAPKVGDVSVALTVPTADGTPTASIYVRKGDSVYVYFAEGGKPLEAVTAIAQKVFAR
jgi:hypothetical protein